MTVQELIDKLTPFKDNINPIGGMPADVDIIVEQDYGIVYLLHAVKRQCSNCNTAYDEDYD